MHQKKNFKFILRHNAHNYGHTFCLVNALMTEMKWISAFLRTVHVKDDYCNYTFLIIVYNVYNTNIIVTAQRNYIIGITFRIFFFPNDE